MERCVQRLRKIEAALARMGRQHYRMACQGGQLAPRILNIYE